MISAILVSTSFVGEREEKLALRLVSRKSWLGPSYSILMF